MRDVRYQIAVGGRADAELGELAAEIEVQQSIDGPTTFRVRFGLEICGQDVELVDDPRLVPGTPDPELTLLAFLDDAPHVLAHGIITERQVSLAEGGSGSWLEVRGTDRRAVMNREERNEAHQGTAAEIAEGILQSYGFEVDTAPTSVRYEEDQHTLNQTETDLEFLEKLAGRNGVRLWLEWDAEGAGDRLRIVETACFKPSPPRPRDNPLGLSLPIRLAPEARPTLRMNAGDGCSNLKSFELGSNAEAPNQTGVIERVDAEEGGVQESEVSEPSDEPLGGDPPPGAPRSRRVVTAGSVEEARVRNAAAIDDAAWSITATAESSAHALGFVPVPHRIVEVAGGGRSISGEYFVKAVTHAIDPSNHGLKLELLRNRMGGG